MDLDQQTEEKAIALLGELLADRPAICALSEEVRARLLENLSSEWRRRVGLRIIKRMSRRQFADFKQRMEAGDSECCERYMRELAPDRTALVNAELAKLLEEVDSSASVLLGLDLARGRQPML